jgi:hypothetical protein
MQNFTENRCIRNCHTETIEIKSTYSKLNENKKQGHILWNDYPRVAEDAKRSSNDLILGTFLALTGKSYDIHEKYQALIQSGNLPNTVHNYEHQLVSILLCFE